MKVLGRRIAVKPLEPTKTIGDKIKMEVPETSQEESQVGIVELVGNEVASPIIEGDKVVYAKYALLELPTGEGTVTIVNEEDVYLVL